MRQPEAQVAVGVVQRRRIRPAPPTLPRLVDVWLPPNFDADSTARYPVLYMHDGQNLFDPALAFISGEHWGVAEAAVRLAAAGHIRLPIIVGVWNSPQRTRDYMPQKPLETPQAQAIAAQFAADAGGPPISDAYLRYLVDKVKPAVDAAYPTLPDRANTFIMGSSMGGLISLYALTEYPHIFGGAGCISTHWLIGESFLVDWLAKALPPPGRHKLYFDFGTGKLDADYEPFQQRMDAHLRTAGFTPNRDWMSLTFEGADHNEKAWRQRVGIPLEFLLGTESGK